MIVVQKLGANVTSIIHKPLTPPKINSRGVAGKAFQLATMRSLELKRVRIAKSFCAATRCGGDSKPGERRSAIPRDGAPVVAGDRNRCGRVDRVCRGIQKTR